MKFNKHIIIGLYTIREDSRTFIIAEAGVNHNGDMNLARKLIDVASESGADAVKFQAFHCEHLLLESLDKAPYQTEATGAGESQFDMLKRLELSIEQAIALRDYAVKKGILFLTTPFDDYSLDQLDALDVPAYKVSSTDITNLLFLKRVARKGKPIILSTGMSYFEEVRRALQEIHSINQDVILLQCTSNYPVVPNEVNLNVMETYQASFDLLTGYSDHTRGLGAAPYAVAKGAKVIEKHFTLDKDLPGPDHKASLSPDELKKLVSEIRKVELFLGDREKKPSTSEMITRKFMQKSLVTTQAIPKGTVFSEENIGAMRAGGKGISALYYDKVIGKKAAKDYSPNEILSV